MILQRLSIINYKNIDLFEQGGDYRIGESEGAEMFVTLYNESKRLETPDQ